MNGKEANLVPFQGDSAVLHSDGFIPFNSVHNSDKQLLIAELEEYVALLDTVDDLAADQLTVNNLYERALIYLEQGGTDSSTINALLQKIAPLAILSLSSNQTYWQNDNYVGPGQVVVNAVLKPSSLSTLPTMDPPLDPEGLGLDTLILAVMSERASSLEKMMISGLATLEAQQDEMDAINDLLLLISDDKNDLVAFDEDIDIKNLTITELDQRRLFKADNVDDDKDVYLISMRGGSIGDKYYNFFKQYNLDWPDSHYKLDSNVATVDYVKSRSLFDENLVDSLIKTLNNKNDEMDDGLALTNNNMSRMSNRYNQSYEMVSTFINKVFQSMGVLLKNIKR